ncbi:MAG: heat-inducible transcriptional repressor HrcA [Candidatus Palauibacterales bacterium]|nr:heat-inducible transcriptional repressor HrcA [Candidatus Palauibacterales bacterium]
MPESLSDREWKVLEAVVHTYIETAEPAGSRTIAKRFPLGVSAATIRNTMSDLEERGYLFHPHTSAGRIPTDRAYRLYVDQLIWRRPVAGPERERLLKELRGDRGVIEGILEKAAQVLGVLTQELGVAVAPTFDEAVLERLELMHVSAERLLIILVVRGGLARTIFLEVRSHLPVPAVTGVAAVLNDRLSGLTLREIRSSLRERLRDSAPGASESELLNIFIEEADQVFDVPGAGQVVLSSAQMLADQPEFHSNERMRNLLELTERRDLLREALRRREQAGITVTIGSEHEDQRFNEFTIVTASYRRGGLSGVIGVMGPTRMPYEKVLALVEHTSRLVEDLGA